MDDTIFRIVSIRRHSGFQLVTYSAEGLRNTHCGVSLVILTVSIYQRFQVIALGCALLVCNRFSQKTIVGITLSPVRSGGVWRVRKYTQDAR